MPGPVYRKHSTSRLRITCVSGLIIAPDNYSLNITDTFSWDGWKTAEAAGCVFLPASGWREGSNVQKVGEWTTYWSLQEMVTLLVLAHFTILDRILIGRTINIHQALPSASWQMWNEIAFHVSTDSSVWADE